MQDVDALAQEEQEKRRTLQHQVEEALKTAQEKHQHTVQGHIEDMSELRLQHTLEVTALKEKHTSDVRHEQERYTSMMKEHTHQWAERELMFQQESEVRRNEFQKTIDAMNGTHARTISDLNHAHEETLAQKEVAAEQNLEKLTAVHGTTILNMENNSQLQLNQFENQLLRSQVALDQATQQHDDLVQAMQEMEQQHAGEKAALEAAHRVQMADATSSHQQNLAQSHHQLEDAEGARKVAMVEVGALKHAEEQHLAERSAFVIQCYARRYLGRCRDLRASKEWRAFNLHQKQSFEDMMQEMKEHHVQELDRRASEQETTTMDRLNQNNTRHEAQIQRLQTSMEEDQLALNALHEEALMKLQKELLDRYEKGRGCGECVLLTCSLVVVFCFFSVLSLPVWLVVGGWWLVVGGWWLVVSLDSCDLRWCGLWGGVCMYPISPTYTQCPIYVFNTHVSPMCPI